MGHLLITNYFRFICDQNIQSDYQRRRLKRLEIEAINVLLSNVLKESPPDMVSPSIPKEDGVKVMKKEPEMMCIDSRGKNRGQLDQIISTQYLVWTNSPLQLFPVPTHIPLI